jgi:serine/threonine protein kinase
MSHTKTDPDFDAKPSAPALLPTDSRNTPPSTARTTDDDHNIASAEKLGHDLGAVTLFDTPATKNRPSNQEDIPELFAPIIRCCKKNDHYFSETFAWNKKETNEEGGSGKVYLVTEKNSGKKFAVKKIKVKFDGKDSYEELKKDCTKLQREIKIHQEATTHPNIVKYHDAWLEPDGATHFLYIQMELCETDLEKLSIPYRGNSVSSEAEASYLYVTLNSVLDICNALIFLRTEKIIHRDLRPANCLKTKDKGGKPVTKVADFGTSRFLSPKDPKSLSPADNLHLVSPEQKKPVGVQDGVDIFKYGGSVDVSYIPAFDLLHVRDSCGLAFLTFVFLFQQIYGLALLIMNVFSKDLRFYYDLERVGWDNRESVEDWLKRRTKAWWQTNFDDRVSPLMELVKKMLNPEPERRPTLEDVATCVNELVQKHWAKKSSTAQSPLIEE